MKTDIRLIALDLDGTLLDSQKRLSARNEKVLRECIARGIYVVPCTGRIWSGVPEFSAHFARNSICHYDEWGYQWKM